MMRNRILFFIVPILIFLSSCSEPEKNPVQDPKKVQLDTETERMIADLRSISEDRSNIQIWHLNRERAVAIDNRLTQIQDPGQRISLLFQSANEWLKAGDYDKSIENFNSIFSYLSQNAMKLPPEQYLVMRELLGVAHLRKGEIENCIENHNAYSCLIPIEKQGQHKNRTGAENALVIFEELLELAPDNDQVKWLYNITQMTLGGYPQNIPAQHLIDPNLLASKDALPRFTDKAMELGIAVNDISGSVVMDDFNNDNYLDLIVSSYGLKDQLRYFENDGHGGFKDLTKAAGLTGLLSGLNMVQADYNNDGWLDVLILRGAWLGKDGKHPNSLLKNNGDGTFSDVTRSSGLYCLFPTQTASWADFNADGWIDLFIANEYSKNTNAPAQLFQNQGDGTFKDVASEKGLAIESFIKGTTWGDYDNDGYPDLYLSAINGENFLMKNGGPSTQFKFTNQSKTAGPTSPERSFPCWFFDYNQDGWEDIFVSGFDFRQFESAAGEVAKDYMGKKVRAEKPRLYLNNQKGGFTEVSEKAKVDKVLFTMGCNFGDLNNDGYPDFYAATGTPDFRAQIPNRMFLNQSGQKFADVSQAGGFAHLQKGHGVSFGDIDLDGDQDIYHVLGGSYDGDNFMNALFVNPGNNNAWLKLKLEGKQSNRAAIGARVVVTATNASGKSRKFFNRVNSGGSFGANPLTIEVGLENYKEIKKVEIYWPGNNVGIPVQGIHSNAFWKIIEGKEKAESIKVDAVVLKGKQEHVH